MFSRLFSSLFGKRSNDTPASQIYGKTAAQSRHQELYTNLAVPDTVMGRYDMLALHVFLVNNRLKVTKSEAQKNETQARRAQLSQSVFDCFLIDLERGLRELGFADTSVHKRKKRLTRSYYGVIEEFDGPIAQNDLPKLASAAKKRYYSQLPEPEAENAADRLTKYIMDAVQCLANQSTSQLLQGHLEWTNQLDKSR